MWKVGKCGGVEGASCMHAPAAIPSLLHKLSPSTSRSHTHKRTQTTPLIPSTSFAGKTTLMDCIAGRKTVGLIKGDILVNGHPKDQGSW